MPGHCGEGCAQTHTALSSVGPLLLAPRPTPAWNSVCMKSDCSTSILHNVPLLHGIGFA